MQRPSRGRVYLFIWAIIPTVKINYLSQPAIQIQDYVRFNI